MIAWGVLGLGAVVLAACSATDAAPKKAALQVAREHASNGFVDACLHPNASRERFEKALDVYEIGYSKPFVQQLSKGYPRGKFAIATDGRVINVSSTGPQLWSCELIDRGLFANLALTTIRPTLEERGFSVASEQTIPGERSTASILILDVSGARYDLIISQAEGNTLRGISARGSGTGMKLVARPGASDVEGQQSVYAPI